MIRFLFSIALGGTASLMILSFLGFTKFTAWGVGFLIATASLLALRFIFGKGQGPVQRRRDITAAQEQGNIRAARILKRERTGLYVNEQPQMEFELLVDSPAGGPFRSTARKIVDMLDLHTIEPGTLLTVAHPNSEYRDVHIIEKPTPEPSYQLTQEAAATARQLPSRNEAKGKKVPLLSNIGLALALLGGFIGAPYLVTSHPEQYVQLVLDGRTSSEDVAEIEHVVMMDPEELNTTLEALTAELGHDQVYSVSVFRTQLVADVPTGSDPGTATAYELQDHKITDQRPTSWPHEISETVAFQLTDIDWDGILAGVPAAQQLLAERGMQNPELQKFTVERAITSLAPIEVRLYFDHEHGEEIVYVDAQGALNAAEQFSQLPEDQQASYLYDAARIREGVEEMSTLAGTRYSTEITVFGDRMSMEAYFMDGPHTGHSASITYRPGEVSDMDDMTDIHYEPDDDFRVDDMNWDVVDDEISQAKTAVEAEGIPNAEVTHMIIQHSLFAVEDTHPLVMNVYLSNDAGNSGSVKITMDGTILDIHV